MPNPKVLQRLKQAGKFVSHIKSEKPKGLPANLVRVPLVDTYTPGDTVSHSLQQELDKRGVDLSLVGAAMTGGASRVTMENIEDVLGTIRTTLMKNQVILPETMKQTGDAASEMFVLLRHFWAQQCNNIIAPAEVSNSQVAAAKKEYHLAVTKFLAELNKCDDLPGEKKALIRTKKLPMELGNTLLGCIANIRNKFGSLGAKELSELCGNELKLVSQNDIRRLIELETRCRRALFEQLDLSGMPAAEKTKITLELDKEMSTALRDGILGFGDSFRKSCVTDNMGVVWKMLDFDKECIEYLFTQFAGYTGKYMAPNEAAEAIKALRQKYNKETVSAILPKVIDGMELGLQDTYHGNTSMNNLKVLAELLKLQEHCMANLDTQLARCGTPQAEIDRKGFEVGKKMWELLPRTQSGFEKRIAAAYSGKTPPDEDAINNFLDFQLHNLALVNGQLGKCKTLPLEIGPLRADIIKKFKTVGHETLWSLQDRLTAACLNGTPMKEIESIMALQRHFTERLLAHIPDEIRGNLGERLHVMSWETISGLQKKLFDTCNNKNTPPDLDAIARLVKLEELCIENLLHQLGRCGSKEAPEDIRLGLLYKQNVNPQMISGLTKRLQAACLDDNVPANTIAAAMKFQARCIETLFYQLESRNTPTTAIQQNFVNELSAAGEEIIAALERKNLETPATRTLDIAGVYIENLASQLEKCGLPEAEIRLKLGEQLCEMTRKTILELERKIWETGSYDAATSELKASYKESYLTQLGKCGRSKDEVQKIENALNVELSVIGKKTREQAKLKQAASQGKPVTPPMSPMPQTKPATPATPSFSGKRLNRTV